jgi:hypothetical protein
MASNLSSIGFVFDNAEAFQTAMMDLAPKAAERIGCEAGDYSIWRSRTGAEIWFHLPFLGTEDRAHDIAGLTPFYEGMSDIAVEVVARFKRDGDNDFEGALTAQVLDPAGGDDSHPITFDAVDFAAHAEVVAPFKARARVVGFAQHVRAFADVAAYGADTSGPLGNIGLAAQAFIPIGQIEAESDDGHRDAPASTALLTGLVREQRLLVNEATGGRFHWLLVDSMAAAFDIVADPQIVSGEIEVGGVVEVGCILIGRLIEKA